MICGKMKELSKMDLELKTFAIGIWMLNAKSDR